MFVAEESILGLPRGWAIAHLSTTIESGWLSEVSDHAYAAGLSVLARAGPPGDFRGLAKTMQVRLSGPRERTTGVAYALRWEASGPAGGLFPILDADLSLVRVDADHARLAIVACYRPQPGVQIDRLLLSRAARTTLQSVVDGLARGMTQSVLTFARTPVRSASRAGEALGLQQRRARADGDLVRLPRSWGTYHVPEEAAPLQAQAAQIFTSPRCAYPSGASIGRRSTL